MRMDSTSELDCCDCAIPPGVRVCYGAVLAGRSAEITRLARGGVPEMMFQSDEPSMRRFTGESKSRTTLVAGCLPVQDSLTLWLTAPFSSFTKARKVLPSLLDVALPFPLEQCVYQFLDFSRTPEKTFRALAVAARRDHVEALLQRYSALGIDPELLDHEGLALWSGSMREAPVKEDSSRVVLNIAESGATMVIGKGGRFTGAHSVGAGVEDVPADSLAARIRRFLLAEMETGQPVQWAFCGVRAADGAFVKKLHADLAATWPGPCIVHDEPESFLPCALAARALNRGELRCNLRRSRLVHPKLPRIAKRQAAAGAVMILIAGLLLCGVNIAWHAINARRLARAKSAVASLAAAVAPDERIQYGMEIADAKKSLKKQSEIAAPFLDAFSPSLSLKLAEIVKAGKDYNMSFEKFYLGKDGVSISGAAADWNQCGEFARLLREMGYTVALDRQEAIADGLVRFVVKGSVSSK